MLRKRRKREVQAAIRKIMRLNVIDAALDTQKRKVRGDDMYLYLEVKNTSPGIRHVYEMDRPVRIGRDDRQNQICICDPEVSREHAVIWAWEGRLYIRDYRVSNPTQIKRGLFVRRPGRDRNMMLRSGDCILLGGVKIKVWIFKGENELI